MSPQSSHAVWCWGLPPSLQLYSSYHGPQVTSKLVLAAALRGVREVALLSAHTRGCREPSRTSLWRETKASLGPWSPVTEMARFSSSPSFMQYQRQLTSHSNRNLFAKAEELSQRMWLGALDFCRIWFRKLFWGQV